VLNKIYDSIGKLEGIVTKFCLVFLTILVLVSAIGRTIGHPASWAIDLATFLFAWCVFLSADIALRKDMMVKVQILTDRLSERANLYLYVVNQIIIVAFLLILIIYGFQLSVTTWYRTFPGLPGFSFTWVTLSVPIGSLFMLFTTFIKMKEKFSKKVNTSNDASIPVE
jgi:TRAP-type C4-dicarboxylate transport system permease small subunit